MRFPTRFYSTSQTGGRTNTTHYIQPYVTHIDKKKKSGNGGGAHIPSKQLTPLTKIALSLSLSLSSPPSLPLSLSLALLLPPSLTLSLSIPSPSLSPLPSPSLSPSHPPSDQTPVILQCGPGPATQMIADNDVLRVLCVALLGPLWLANPPAHMLVCNICLQ